MKIGLVGIYNRDNTIEKINQKGYDEVEVDFNDLVGFSFDKELRCCGIGKKGCLYKLTLKSWKEIREIYRKRGLI